MGEIASFIAGDKTTIKEVLHPKSDPGADPSYSLAYATLSEGTTSLPHRLRGSSEVYVITEGKGKVHIDQETRDVSKGDIVFIPPGARQYIQNTGNETLGFYCIVAPPWREEAEDVFEE